MSEPLPPGLSHPLPDPLTFASGAPVRTRRDWTRRRTELLRLFEHEVYGPLPPRPEKLTATVLGHHADFLGGRGTLKLLRLTFDDIDAPAIDLMLASPKRKRAPVFLGMNFCGNHALVADPRIPLTREWVYTSCAGCVDGRATDAGRGSQAVDWPIGQILERGYALASFCSSDIDADLAEKSGAVWSWVGARNKKPVPPHDRGSISAWAWGFHRCVDYLSTDPDIDRKRIAALGHSRNGKTALWAAATDPRLAVAFPHQSGCGGAAPSRSSVGESVARINTVFPHWFSAGFKRFNDRPQDLALDQNCLMALVAPRPLLISNAVEDTWANPDGQLAALHAAAPVWSLLGADPGPIPDRAEVGKLLGARLGVFLRPGTHALRPDDWAAFLDFADKNL